MRSQNISEVICLGEALIDFIAMDSGVSLLDVTAFRKAPGGAPANVAAGLSKLGRKSAFIGKVGDDAFGRYLETVFVDAGIDTSHMLFDKITKTGLAFVSLTSEGVPEFMFYRDPSADMLLSKDEIDQGFIRSARAFHFGSITLISEPSKSATEAAIRYAKDARILISYDPNFRRPLWPNEDYARRTMIEAMQYPHIVKLNEEELEFLVSGNNIPTRTKELLSNFRNIGLVVVTRGSKGCYFATPTCDGDLPAFQVDVEDTTGAGDGFVAAMLSCILDLIMSPDDICELDIGVIMSTLRFANAAAALTTTKKGAIPALPLKAEVDEFLKGFS